MDFKFFLIVILLLVLIWAMWPLIRSRMAGQLTVAQTNPYVSYGGGY